VLKCLFDHCALLELRYLNPEISIICNMSGPGHSGWMTFYCNSFKNMSFVCSINSSWVLCVHCSCICPDWLAWLCSSGDGWLPAIRNGELPPSNYTRWSRSSCSNAGVCVLSYNFLSFSRSKFSMWSCYRAPFKLLLCCYSLLPSDLQQQLVPSLVTKEKCACTLRTARYS
jgi:hypothetical protein